MREAALYLPLYHTKKKLKIKDIVGFELADESKKGSKNALKKSSNPLDQFNSLEEKIAYKNKEVTDLFNSFD